MESATAAPTQDEELLAWLTLSHASGLGLGNKHRLLHELGSATAICTASSDRLRAHGLSNKTIDQLTACGSAHIDADLAWGNQADNHIISVQHPAYPQRLKELPDAPLLLYVKGDIDTLNTIQLGVVGSRNPSTAGRDTAEQFAHFLATYGLTVTSGLALGIDAAAHLGALRAQGLTIAVAGTGLDRIYPAQHAELARRIAKEGALVSEFPVGTPPKRENFPRRNRIISGLSSGILVVEAAVQSGSLITARHAMEQGRDVFAIPGSIHNPMSKGCHALIRQGAKLVETGEHILEEIAPLIAVTLSNAPEQTLQSTTTDPLSPDQQALLKYLDYSPTSIDQLVERSGFAAAEVASMLLILELQGHVGGLPGSCYQRLQPH